MTCATSSSPADRFRGGRADRLRPGRAHRDGGRTTLGTYAHFQAAQDRQAAELMERLLKLPAAHAPRGRS